MRPPLPILLAVCLLGPVGTARAQATLSVSAGEVRSGEVVSITWSGLPHDVHELELELSLDGGRWLRISPELEGHEKRFDWRSPAELAGHARVRLRFGRRHEERIGPEVALRIVNGARQAPEAAMKLPDWWRVGARQAGTLPRSFVPWRAEFSPAHASGAIARSTEEHLPAPRTPTRDARGHIEDAASRIQESRAFVPPGRMPLRN